MTVAFRPFVLLCPACKAARDTWARRSGFYVPVTVAPSPCQPCVERCEAARFHLASKGKDPIRVFTYTREDGTTGSDEVLVTNGDEDDLAPFLP